MSLSSRFLFLIAFPLLWSDALNQLFADTPLVIWKQAIMVVAWLLAFKEGVAKFGGLLIFSLTSLTILIIVSIIRNHSAGIVLYNSFLYISWVPFFVLSCNGGHEALTDRFRKYWLIFVVISVIGLLLDFYTSIFDFVNRQGADSSYIESLGIAKRSAFFFIASTMVMPLLAYPALNAVSVTESFWVKSLVGGALLIGSIPTGSGSSIVCALFFSLVIFFSGRFSSAKAFQLAGVLLLVLIGYSVMIQDERFQIQLDRFMDNQNADSEANLARRLFWETAIADISDFSVVDHVFGAGLGVTNDNKDNYATYGHGESSFFQAYIEGGVIAFLMRLSPFIFLFYGLLKSRISSEVVRIFVWGFMSLVAIALAPTFGNIPFQFVLGMLLGQVWRMSKAGRYV